MESIFLINRIVKLEAEMSELKSKLNTKFDYVVYIETLEKNIEAYKIENKELTSRITTQGATIQELEKRLRKKNEIIAEKLRIVEVRPSCLEYSSSINLTIIQHELDKNMMWQAPMTIFKPGDRICIIPYTGE
jgi:molybdopterin converting factor small subunit